MSDNTVQTYSTKVLMNKSGETLRLRLGVRKGIELDEHKIMEWNRIYLSKGKEWNGIKSFYDNITIRPLF